LKFSGLKYTDKEVRKSLILIDAEDPIKVAEALSKMPGVDYTAVVETTSSNYEDVVESVSRAGVKLIYPDETFAVRVDLKGSLPYLSRDIEFAACASIIGELGKKNVRQDKKNPSKVIYVKIDDGIACIFYYKYEGPGGKPVGSQGKALCPLSGDNNSAVASWLMARQGILPYLIFFDTRPYFDHSYSKRAITMATLLREFLPVRQYHLTALKMGLIIDSLKQICSSEILPFLLNRMVMHISCSYADRIGVNAIVIGERFEKGSFQTLTDLYEISSKYNKQILSPLIGLSKKEILDYSKRIGTFRFAKESEGESKRPPTEPSKNAITDAESKIEIDRLVEEVLSKAISVDLKRGFDDVHDILNNYFLSKV
jgi:thiamine biosynthesis protein ThiI